MNKKELEKIKQKALEEHIPIIMDDTLEVVDKILNEVKPKRILEIGTAVGYSAMCFSEYLEDGGIIDTIERDEERIAEAKVNIKNVGVEDKINIYEGDAVEILPTLNGKYDMVFIDAAKGQYTKFFEKYKNFLNPNGTIITDNIKFHGYVGESSKLDKGNLKSLVEKIENYIEFLKSNTEFDTKFYDIGDGLSVSTWKHE